MRGAAGRPLDHPHRPRPADRIQPVQRTDPRQPGVVARAADVVEHTGDGSYVLTESGRALEPAVFALAAWGARWTFGEPRPEELDPDILLWWLHRRLDPTDLPKPRFTVYVPFTDHRNRYWIVVEQEPSLCWSTPALTSTSR